MSYKYSFKICLLLIQGPILPLSQFCCEVVDCLNSSYGVNPRLYKNSLLISFLFKTLIKNHNEVFKYVIFFGGFFNIYLTFEKAFYLLFRSNINIFLVIKIIL